ncbi:MAG: hypothetical protein KDE27_18805 [Planctomycetes bacterium]|nr:hypothetical protein [Planctomycetota bacterium]
MQPKRPIWNVTAIASLVLAVAGPLVAFDGFWNVVLHHGPSSGPNLKFCGGIGAGVLAGILGVIVFATERRRRRWLGLPGVLAALGSVWTVGEILLDEAARPGFFGF